VFSFLSLSVLNGSQKSTWSSNPAENYIRTINILNHRKTLSIIDKPEREIKGSDSFRKQTVLKLVRCRHQPARILLRHRPQAIIELIFTPKYDSILNRFNYSLRASRHSSTTRLTLLLSLIQLQLRWPFLTLKL